MTYDGHTITRDSRGRLQKNMGTAHVILFFSGIIPSKGKGRNMEGNFVNILRHPEGVPFDNVAFHTSGFCTVLMEGDGFVYTDFRVKNLPSIFQ